MTKFADFFLHASDEEKIRVFTEAANLANQDQRRYMMINCPKCGSTNIRIATNGITCNDCSKQSVQIIETDNTGGEITLADEKAFYKKAFEVIDDTPPIDGEIVADGKTQVLIADEPDQIIMSYQYGQIQGQIDAYEWLLEHGSGGGNWRRLCVQKINQLKGE